ncbi:hypothetical protein G6F42_027898 [Rhizopus arrhizus]|nr:hypothetical protein G6F42_027898 [Rhizopus arrhizus]
MTKYIGILNRSLKEYNAFFQEHAQAFLNPATTPANVTLPSLHARLQGSVLSLIDSKREVQREILWSRMSQKDISLVTRLVKQLRPPLHGIGLSLLANKRDHTELLFEMNKAGQDLTDLCEAVDPGRSPAPSSGPFLASFFLPQSSRRRWLGRNGSRVWMKQSNAMRPRRDRYRN